MLCGYVPGKLYRSCRCVLLQDSAKLARGPYPHSCGYLPTVPPSSLASKLSPYPDTCLLKCRNLAKRSQPFPKHRGRETEGAAYPPSVLTRIKTAGILGSRLGQFSREPPSSEPRHAPWAEHKTSLMAFAHLPHAWREPWYCLAPTLPSLITLLLALGGVALPPPGGSWGAGPRSVQRVLCLGWKQLFSPLWKHGLGLYNQAFRGWIKGHCSLGCRDYGAVLRAADNLSSAPNPCTSSAWAGPV